MKAQLVKLTDRLGATYLGFKFPLYEISDFLMQWEDNYETDITTTFAIQQVNRTNRDGENYHLTCLSVAEFNQVDKRQALSVLNEFYDFTVLGIGKVNDKGNEAQFIAVSCVSLQDYRYALNLASRDFHITLGFDKKDVFSKPKDKSSIYIYG